MTYPNAKIIAVSEDGYNEVKYENSDHYAIFKNFINHPNETIQKLIQDEE